MCKSVNPSDVTPITTGQIAKCQEMVGAAVRKSGLPGDLVQDVIMSPQGGELVNEFVASLRTRVEELQRAREPHILKRLPFDPEKFSGLGKGWSIYEELKQRTGDNLDAGQIIAKTYLKKGENYTDGETRLSRIKEATNEIQLDDKDFMALWSEKGHATLKWLYDAKGITFLSFWGTVLRNPNGHRNVLCLSRLDDGSWRWYYCWLDSLWGADYPASLLASSN